MGPPRTPPPPPPRLAAPRSLRSGAGTRALAAPRAPLRRLRVAAKQSAETGDTRMLNSARVIAFTATKDPARAKAFYENTLSLKLISDDPFALVFDANG